MLSVLIPTFNFNTVSLVKEIYKQCVEAQITFEILVLDDASSLYLTENEEINRFTYCSYRVLNQNIGRSSIRNLLAQNAAFAYLLFLDADVLPVHQNFIESYVNEISKERYLVVGGICYQQAKPPKKEYLRWYYGYKRETKSAADRQKNPYYHFSSANFLVQKKLFLSIQFNVAIKNYGHEDTLFAFDFMKHAHQITHINNQVYHLGLESNEVFIEKSLISVESAWFLKKNGLIDDSFIKILAFYSKLQKFKVMNWLIYFVGKKAEPFICKNLVSAQPSLKLLDFYKLYHLIKLNRNA
ncbi:glycosyltransferase family 2 protein [Paenimyroides aestuarii]|uniref:Glycosyltransferase n=1 Tax=Paenimyroides aestuarii TaxID=2968490 RepID=A0ABY5NQV1_9FLAO|nr:glycosyltransferase [Paenimyroides aestuarii]UUV20946.1 glycosyltransferase [Paenimyroides aestuarii]